MNEDDQHNLEQWREVHTFSDSQRTLDQRESMTKFCISTRVHKTLSKNFKLNKPRF